jgi:hypothetical protein
LGQTVTGVADSFAVLREVSTNVLFLRWHPSTGLKINFLTGKKQTDIEPISAAERQISGKGAETYPWRKSRCSR